MLGCALHRTGLCLVLVMLRRNDLDFAATGTLRLFSAQLKTSFQLSCGHVLTRFRMLLRYFMLGNLCEVLMLPWLVRIVEPTGINIPFSMGMGCQILSAFSHRRSSICCPHPAA